MLNTIAIIILSVIFDIFLGFIIIGLTGILIYQMKHNDFKLPFSVTEGFVTPVYDEKDSSKLNGIVINIVCLIAVCFLFLFFLLPEIAWIKTGFALSGAACFLLVSISDFINNTWKFIKRCKNTRLILKIFICLLDILIFAIGILLLFLGICLLFSL